MREPSAWIAQPEQQLHERRLSRARRPDDADDLARLHFEVDVLEHWPAGYVGERHILEPDGADPGDLVASFGERSLAVARQFRLELLQVGGGLVEVLDVALEALGIPERPQHDDHDGADRCEVGADRVRDGEPDDQQDDRHPLIDGGNEPLMICAERLLRRSVDHRLGLVLDRIADLEDAHLLERRRDIADGRRELVFGVRSSHCPATDRGPQWTQHEPDDERGRGRGDRGDRIDEERRREQCHKVQGDLQQRPKDAHRAGVAFANRVRTSCSAPRGPARTGEPSWREGTTEQDPCASP